MADLACVCGDGGGAVAAADSEVGWSELEQKFAIMTL
jgi:hypothetical protein